MGITRLIEIQLCDKALIQTMTGRKDLLFGKSIMEPTSRVQRLFSFGIGYKKSKI